MSKLPSGIRQGINDHQCIGYSGPNPDGGTIHRYRFTLYALDRALNLAGPATRRDLLRAMNGFVLARAHVTGTCLRRPHLKRVRGRRSAAARPMAMA
jgi:phosphatidylethanolamine-binding protein (PEBP) family uncharacterized protein